MENITYGYVFLDKAYCMKILGKSGMLALPWLII